MKSLKLFVLLFAGVILSACQTTQTHYDGEIKFSEPVAKYFEKFLEDRESEDFFVAIDGRNYAMYVTCGDTICSASSGNRAKWVRKCNDTSSPVPCGVFASKNKLLWESPGNFMPYKSEIVFKKYGSYFH